MLAFHSAVEGGDNLEVRGSSRNLTLNPSSTLSEPLSRPDQWRHKKGHCCSVLRKMQSRSIEEVKGRWVRRERQLGKRHSFNTLTMFPFQCVIQKPQCRAAFP